jgi:hypothetical protein
MHMPSVRSARIKLASAVIAGMVASLALSTEAGATVIGFDLTIIATSTNSAFGTGVTEGDTFTGMVFFDDEDPNYLADGIWERSVLNGDMLTIAGVSFDSELNSTFWDFNFSSGAPVCFDIGGQCGDGQGQGLDLFFTDDFSGFAFDAELDRITFSYEFSPKDMPEPSSLSLWATGLALLVLIGRRRRKGAVAGPAG